jgi:single-strand DNA-binding protein
MASRCPQAVDNSGGISTGGELLLPGWLRVGHRESAPAAGTWPVPSRWQTSDRLHGKGLATVSQENYIMLRGFVTSDPKFWQTANTQTAVAEIRVGSTPRRLNRETGEWQDGQTSYYTVKCWRRLAVNAKGSLHKGDMIVVRGKVYMRSWLDNEQRPRTAVEIEADSIGHDLAYGHTIFTRGERGHPGNMAGLAAGEQARQDLAAQDGDEARDADVEYQDAAYADQAEPVVAGLTSDYGSAETAAVPF